MCLVDADKTELWNNKSADVSPEIKKSGKKFSLYLTSADDGPNADYTELLLEGLEERGVRAMFFLPGSKVEENDIILLHDASESSVKAAFKIIDALEEEGYVFVTVDEILFD